MDPSRFDDLAQALAGATSRRGAVAALAGLLAAGTGLDAQAKRRKRCKPACAAGQTCVKGECVCENGGTPCGASCCAIGQVCREGQCGAPEPPVCIPVGQACKGTGRSCCDGRVCGSGQGGKGDVACYVPAGGSCRAADECVYDSRCIGGVCVANEHQGGGGGGGGDDGGGGGVDGPYTVCASGCRYTSIADAVAKAAPGSTLTIGPGSFEACNVQIDKDLTIVGAGAGPEPEQPAEPTQVPGAPPSGVISPTPPAGYDPVAANAGGTTISCAEAQGTSRGRRAERTASVERRIFTIPAGRTVRIESVLLAFGKVVDPAGLTSQTTGMGGQILNSGTLTLRSSAFVFGKAVFGGQVANLGTLTIDGCAFVLGSAEGHASSNGGALWNAGVATISDTGLRRTAFAWNAAIFSGGAIHNAISTISAVSSPSLTVSGAAWLAGNVAQVLGGAIASVNVPLTINGSVDIFSNLAGSDGGGVSVDGLTILTCEIQLAGASQVRFNSAGTLGGGIAVLGCSLKILGTSQVRSNSAKEGGGVRMSGKGELVFAEGARVTGNNARGGYNGYGGGGVAQFGISANGYATTATSTIINGNTAAGTECRNYFWYYGDGDCRIS